MSKQIILDKALKNELDAFFFKYSNKDYNSISKAVEILKYARDILTDVRTEEEADFDILNANSNKDYKKIEELREEKENIKFFKILDYFLDAGIKEPELIDKQKSLYIQDILTF